LESRILANEVQELATALMSAHPKIQKMCEEESEDHEAVAKLFEINDSINRTIERYKLVKKGDLEAAAKIPAGTLGTSGAGVGRGNNNELSLIDLGGPEDSEPAATPSQSSTTSSQPQKTGNALEDDLLGLSIGGDTYGQGGALSLGSTNGLSSPSPSSSQPHFSNAQITSLFNSPPQQSSPALPSNAFGGLSAFAPPASSSRPPSTVQNVAPSPKPDPFAALSSHTPRGASPFQFQQSIHPSSHASHSSQSSNDLLGGFTAPPPQPSAPQQATAAADDEWTFTSALPPSQTTNTLTIASKSILISWTISRSPTVVDHIDITSTVSNVTQQPISELTFQVAVSKGYKLKMEPQSGRDLAPGQKAGIRQAILLLNVPSGEGGKVKMRWKVGYVIAGRREEDMGEVAALGVS
jgi:ADP-ribosylation factor-binding protein GGA